MTTPVREDVRHALCCECGNQRTVKAKAGKRNPAYRGESPEHIALMMQTKAAEYWSKVVPWHRGLEDLKCTACNRITRHADVCVGDGVDESEQANAETSKVQVIGTLTGYDLVKSLGTKVIEVPDLGREVIYVEAANVALVDPALSPEQRVGVVEWILAEIVRTDDDPEGGA